MALSRAVVAALAAVLTLSRGADAMVGQAAPRAGRGLVELAVGLAVENSWIATINGSQEECEAFRNRIVELRRRTPSTSEVVGIETRQTSIETTCFVTFDGDSALAEAVRAEVEVQNVEPNLVVKAEAARRRRRRKGKTNTPINVSPVNWGLNRIDQPDLPLSEDVPFTTAYTGEGVNIYIIDTGVNTNHNEFVNRLGPGKSFIPRESDEVDGNGHGSHCAGIAAGTTYGVAPGATIFGVKALSAGGSGSTDGIIDAIEYVVAHQKNKFNGAPAVISMSLGGGKNQALNSAVSAASKKHIVVVAAGNDNSDACSYSPASAGGNARGMGVITVGSTDRTDSRSSFSNYGSCVDIFAPGSAITSAWMGRADASNTISGTSMATPHVAGVAALMLQKHAFDRELAQHELLSAAVYGRIADVKYSSPNLLLQTPNDYTGPPTPQPTTPPTLAPPQICANGKCFDFEPSKFGPSWDFSKVFSGNLVNTRSSDKQGCKPVARGTYSSNDIVLVERGLCLFFDKVAHAEKGGAKAVIFFQDSTDAPFPANYYGNSQVEIPSLMIGLSEGLKFRGWEDETVFIGSTSLMPESETPSRNRRRKRKAKAVGLSEAELDEATGTGAA